MALEIGHVEAIFRYPVKSMAGERLEVAELGWHGIDGDRRFALRRTPPSRPNVVVRLLRPNPFQEDQWLGGVLSFGEPGEGSRVSVTTRDVRCSMVNFDPDSGRSAPEVLKSIVRLLQNTAGVYGTVLRTGRLVTGQTIRLQELAEEP